MKKILIFEPNSNQAISIVKFIKKYSDFYIVGCIEKKIIFDNPFQTYYDNIIVSNFLEVDINSYDYVLPMGADSSLRIISKYKTLSYCNNIYFSSDNLIVFNKPNMLTLVDNLDIPIPTTYYKKKYIIKYPVFYKEDFERGGGVRGIAHNKNDVPNKNRLIYQTYIDTPSTYGFGFLAINGKVLTYTVHKEVISYPESGGSSVVIEQFYDKKIVDYSKKILKKIKYDGWGLVEFKYCNIEKDYYFMEVNGKFWASIEFLLQNNTDFLKYLLNINYNTKIKTDRIIFINRLFEYNVLGIIKNYHYIFSSHITKESSFVFQLIRKVMPKKSKKIIKYFLN